MVYDYITYIIYILYDIMLILIDIDIDQNNIIIIYPLVMTNIAMENHHHVQ